MEFGTLVREIRIEATREIVFEVITKPDHIRQWWSDDALFEPAPSAHGELIWGDRDQVAPFVVVDLDPPRVFSFYWTAPEGETPEAGNSLLVRFDLEAEGNGTLLRLTESGFREKGWEGAVLKEAYEEHARGWDLFLPRLAEYATGVVSPR